MQAGCRLSSINCEELTSSLKTNNFLLIINAIEKINIKFAFMRSLFLFFSFFLLTSLPANAQSFDIKPIPNQVVNYPNALLLSFELTGDVPVTKVHFSYQSDIDDAVILGQSMYWEPTMDAAGRHRIKLIATAPGGTTASETFTVKVTPFNAPPRFIPVRKITIPVGFEYTLPISAIDPDGMHKHLIRYLGVSLPRGATVNEQTGLFTWTPTAKQIGKNTFRVIATDQYGAASSIDITIHVAKPTNASE